LLHLMQARRVWSSSVVSSGDGLYSRFVQIGPPYRDLIRVRTYPTKLVVQKELDSLVSHIICDYRPNRPNPVRAHHRMALVFGQDWQDLAFRRKKFFSRTFGTMTSAAWERAFFHIRKQAHKVLSWLNQPGMTYSHRPFTTTGRVPPLTGPTQSKSWTQRREPRALAGGAYPEQPRAVIKVGQSVPESYEDAIPNFPEVEVEIDPSSYMNLSELGKRRAARRFLTELHLELGGVPLQILNEFGYSQAVYPRDGALTVRLNPEEYEVFLLKAAEDCDLSDVYVNTCLVTFGPGRVPEGREHICSAPHPGCKRCNTLEGYLFDNPWTEWSVDIAMALEAWGRRARLISRGLPVMYTMLVYNGKFPVPKTIART